MRFGAIDCTANVTIAAQQFSPATPRCNFVLGPEEARGKQAGVGVQQRSHMRRLQSFGALRGISVLTRRTALDQGAGSHSTTRFTSQITGRPALAVEGDLHCSTSLKYCASTAV